MTLKHYYRWLTSRSYRMHYWVGKNYSKHKAAWRLSAVFFLLIALGGIERLDRLRAAVVEDKRGNRARKIIDEIIAKVREAEHDI